MNARCHSTDRNIRADDRGKEKPIAFQGHRQHALECVVKAFRLATAFAYKEQTPNREAQAEPIRTKRDFVAEIQTILDPRQHQQETTKLIESAKISQTALSRSKNRKG